MRIVAFGILALISAVPAAANPGLRSATLESGRATSTSYGGLGAPTNTKQDICLINKRTGKRVCKDHVGWRREADRMARLDADRESAPSKR